jgi:hypothetical protein
MLSPSTGSGIISLIHPVFGRMNGIVFIIILTTVVNILLSGLITFRILHHEKVLRKLLGIRRVSPYIRVMAMCVESCSLIIFTSILFIGLYYSNVPDGFLIPLLLLPYVCVSELPFSPQFKY